MLHPSKPIIYQIKHNVNKKYGAKNIFYRVNGRKPINRFDLSDCWAPGVAKLADRKTDKQKNVGFSGDCGCVVDRICCV